MVQRIRADWSQYESNARAGERQGRPLLAEGKDVHLRSPQVERDRGHGAAEDDRGPGAAAVEDSATPLGRDREAAEEHEQEQTGALRALPERDLGVEAGEEEQGDEADREQEQHHVV